MFFSCTIGDHENINDNQKFSTETQSNFSKIKPYDVIRGNINQANKKFNNSAGKQCTAMAASAVLMATFLPIKT